MITVNDQPLEAWLLRKVPQDVKQIRQSQIDDISIFATKSHRPIGPVKQEYDTSPSAIKIYSKGEIMEIELKEHYELKLAELKYEATMDQPNRQKLLIAAMCDERFLSITELCEKINSETNAHVQPNSASAMFSQYKKPIKKPIIYLFEVQKDNITNWNSYRLFPPAVKIKLPDLYQLTLRPGRGSYSLADAIREVPELAEFINKKREQESDDKTAGKKVDLSFNPIDTTKKPLPSPKNKTDDKTGPPPIIGSQEMSVNININFGPVRVLFGLDNHSNN